jgi:hypothetical protein
MYFPMFRHIDDIPRYQRPPTFKDWVNLNQDALGPLFDNVKGDITKIKTIMPDDECPEEDIDTYRPEVGLSFDCGGHLIEFELVGHWYHCEVESDIDTKATYSAFRLKIEDYRYVGIEFLDSDFEVEGSFGMKFLKRRPFTECGIDVTFKGYTSYIKVLC